jgi:predicted SprT family Zn-dependent metalloprotease
MQLRCSCGGELSREQGNRKVNKQEKYVCKDCGKEGWYIERRDGQKLFIGCVG